MAETGVMINADLSAELLASLFAPGYPLHDGAVSCSGDEIVAAGVMLPLAEREGSLEHYGTRHRAALGVTEQTDALAIVVSEESGSISLAAGWQPRASISTRTSCASGSTACWPRSTSAAVLARIRTAHRPRDRLPMPATQLDGGTRRRDRHRAA